MTDQTTTTLEGGCLCGAVRYQATAPVLRALCHCDSCKRATGAPCVGWIMFERGNVTFTTGAPTTFASSPGVERGFCNRCGTSLSFTAEYLPGLIDLTIGSLDEPGAAVPDLHSWTSRQLPWVQLGDDKPRHAEFPDLPG
ncbi:MAG TPA: GFA family protein [Myxococcota bacterium]